MQPRFNLFNVNVLGRVRERAVAETKRSRAYVCLKYLLFKRTKQTGLLPIFTKKNVTQC